MKNYKILIPYFVTKTKHFKIILETKILYVQKTN